MEHVVEVSFERPIQVERKDLVITVKTDGAKLGELRISKGSLVWMPKGNSVNGYELPWENFAELMSGKGDEKRLARRLPGQRKSPSAVTI